MNLYQVSVNWEKEGEIKHIEKGHLPIEPSKESLEESYFDLIMYSKQNGNMLQIAVESDKQPFWINAAGQRFPLFQAQRNLWIVKGDWTSSYNKIYHKCPSINTSGEITIINEYKKIVIDIHPSIDDFDFEALKDDFEAQLWELITQNDSQVTTEKKELRYGNKIYTLPQSQLIIRFIEQFKTIAKNPKEELIQTIEHVPSYRVKPINATLKYVTKFGIASKTLPSKSYIRNSDNYENRYLCFMLRQVNRLVRFNHNFSHNKLQTLAKELEDINLEIEELKNPSPLNRNELKSEIEITKKRIATFHNSWDRIVNHLTTVLSQDAITMNIFVKRNAGIDQYWCTVNDQFCLVNFSQNMSSLFSLTDNINVKIIANLEFIGNAGNHPNYEISNISSIELKSESISTLLKKQEANFTTLEANNFNQFVLLNHTQKVKVEQERSHQIQILEKRKEKIQSQICNFNKFENESDNLIPQLQILKKHPFLKLINRNRQVVYKPSMTYLQNSEYRKAYEIFTELLNQSGINVEIFEQYEQAIRYGIRDMPQVYELWTLIKLIKTLESFGFKSQKSDYKNLLQKISPKSRKLDKSVSIGYRQQLQGRSINLHYQPKLINGKRPDVVLEIKCGDRTINIVLDAKFKNFNYKKSAIIEAQEMKSKYGLNSDCYVFTLHPCKDLKDQYGNTIRLTNLGGDYIHDEDGNKLYLNHEYGYIMVKPNQTHSLKKVLGMSLEYLLDYNHNAENSDTINPKPDFPMICIECGGKDFEYETRKSKRKGKGKKDKYYYSECYCRNCEHQAHLDYCWNCKTKLFKHGRYWDYHKTSAWSSFDIHCPSCGMTVADRS